MLNNEERQLLKEQQQVTDDAKRVQVLATSIDQDEYTLQERYRQKHLLTHFVNYTSQ